MLCQISREKHAGLDAASFDMLHQGIAVHARAAGDQEAEPAGIRCRTGLRKDQSVLRSRQRRLQPGKVVLSPLHEGGELVQLGAADAGLHVRGLQIVAEVGIDILVVVSLREFSVLAVEAVSAEIVPSGGAAAVPAPVPEGADDTVQQRVPCVYRAALPHGHMVRRVEAGGADIAHRAGEISLPVQRIGASQSVAVVLHKPQLMGIAEGLHGRKIKGIPQGMGQHHGFRLLRKRAFQLCDVDVVLGNGHIHEDRDGAVLDHGRHRGGESAGHRDDLVPGTDLPLF